MQTSGVSLSVHLSCSETPRPNVFHIENKSLLVTLFLIAYSAVTTPAYWLKDVSLSNFNSFIALYVVFGVFTFILMALLNIYIPHCMRVAKEKEAAISPQIDSPPTDGGTSREYGFSMSVFGTLANGLSATLMLVIVIIIARTIPGPDGQTSGLLVTTIIGFVAVAGSIAAYYGLPELPAKSYPEAGGWKGALLELLTPYREMLLRRRNMMFLLVAYTIYTDSLFALFSVTGQLYYAELKPDTLEYSLYSLSGNLYSVVFTLIFYVLQRRFQWDLGKCLIFGYALILVVPIWGCIGLAPYINFGFKVSYLRANRLYYLTPGLTHDELARTAGNSTSSSSSATSRRPSPTRPSGSSTRSRSPRARRSCGSACR